MITTWFTPRSSVAVNRMHAFARYLDHEKFEVIVITVQPDGNSAEEEELFGARVYRVRNSSFFRRVREKAGEPRLLHYLKVLWNVMLGYARQLEYSDWMKRSTVLLEKIHSESKIDLVISSYSPAEPHLVAFMFCKNHPEVKWIADMRDEMSKNPHLASKEIRLLTRIESQIAGRVDAVLSVSHPILNDFRKLMPAVKYFEEVRNGYDHEVEPRQNFNPVFTIAYAGSFYGKRKPHTFFAALKRFIASQRCDVKLQFIGVHRNFTVPPEFEASCVFIPHLSNAETIKLLAEADATLLILPPVESKGAYSGKIFEYISVMKPVIAVVDASDVAAQLVLDLDAGFVADFNDIHEIEKAITAAYMLWKGHGHVRSDRGRVMKLHRKHEVAKVERLIDKLLVS